MCCAVALIRALRTRDDLAREARLPIADKTVLWTLRPTFNSYWTHGGSGCKVSPRHDWDEHAAVKRDTNKTVVEAALVGDHRPRCRPDISCRSTTFSTC